MSSDQRAHVICEVLRVLCRSSLSSPALPPPGTRRRLSSLVQRGATRFEGGRTSEPIAQREIGMRLSRRTNLDLHEAWGMISKAARSEAGGLGIVRK